MKTLFAALAFVLAAPTFAASTWTIDTSQPTNLVRSSKLAHTTGSESAPPNPAKAAEIITVAAPAVGDYLMISGAGGQNSSVQFIAHASANTGRYFSVAGNDAADATALANAINRAGLTVTANAVGAVVTITAKDFGTAYNGITFNMTGVGAFTCTGACVTTGGTNVAGLALHGIKGFALHAETSGAAMTAGGKFVAYLFNPHLGRFAPCPDLDVTVAANVYQSFAGFAVAADWSHIAYVPVGTGQPGTLYIDGRKL